MSDFSGKIVIINDLIKGGDLFSFLSKDLSKIESIFSDGDVHEFSNKDYYENLLLEHKQLLTIVDITKLPIVIMFLKNTAGIFETIHVIGYELEYDHKLKMVVPICTGSDKYTLDNVGLEVYHQYMSLPS